MAWFVSFLMLLTAAITWPIGKLLDWVLGAESPLFKRRELKALMSIHADPMVGAQGMFRVALSLLDPLFAFLMTRRGVLRLWAGWLQ